MPCGFLLSVLLLKKRKFQESRVMRRCLRNSLDPMDIPDAAFVALYRLNKDSFVSVLREVAPRLRKYSIPPILQLTATLRYLATGSFQGVIANDLNISLARTTFCKLMWRVINLLEDTICPIWIKLEMTGEEIRSSKNFFFTKYGIPGVIGCIDGTHVRIIKPPSDESLYYNRKGYFSLNVMIICDNTMKIRAVDASRPGSCHDSFVWGLSAARSYFMDLHQSSEYSGWLLGDSGYALEPFLMIPYRAPSYGSTQHKFNKRHCSARNIVERTIGNIKSRFRCLQQGALHYIPSKAVKIINVCCALHNICKHYNVIFDEEPPQPTEESGEDEQEFFTSEEALSIRDSIAASLR